MKKDFKTLSY